MKTTERGYENRNGQINLGVTAPPRHGTDRGQYVYVMHCPVCARNYGVNGSDIFERKCPTHLGGGKPGLSIAAGEPH